MIQAPQTQYVPQQPVQTGYQQQGAYTPVQQQNHQGTGAIYNYPVNSNYAPVQERARSQFNGVNIEILNPQGQGGYGMPMQGAINGQDNGQFNGVNLAIKNPQGQGVSPYSLPNPMPAQFYPAQQQLMYPQGYYPQQQTPYNNQPIIDVTPQNNVSQPDTPTVPEPQIQSAPPLIGEPQSQSAAEMTPEAYAESFAGRLKTDDLDAQKTAIEEIANQVKLGQVEGAYLLDSVVFNSLADIINKDTSNLEGPTPEILALRQKNPDELTEAEKASIEPTPIEKAEMNKRFALYTLSFMYERAINEVEKGKGYLLKLDELPQIETVSKTAKQNDNPMLRIDAVAALSHIARPEYKDDLGTIFGLISQYDEDENVRNAAQKATENLAA